MSRGMLLLALVLAGFASGCAAQLGGLARNGRTLYAVSHSPAALLSCETLGSRISCRPKPFRARSLRRSDLRGLAYVPDGLFYTAQNGSATTQNSGQRVENFSQDTAGNVHRGRCAPFVLPLFGDDERRAQGLSALAYDPERKLLYLAKRSGKARLFALQLDAQSCPTGNFIELHPPQPLPDYAALAYSPKRQTLYLYSAKRHALVEWSLKSDAITRRLSDWPKAQKRLKALNTITALLLDDSDEGLLLVDEQGSFLRLPL